MTHVLFTVSEQETTVALSADLETLSERTTFKTPPTFKVGMTKLSDTITELLGKQKPNAIAGGLCGLLSEDKTMLENDAILTKWIGHSITDALADTFQVSVTLENNTALAGVGEAVYGAGQGLEIIAYHHIGEVIDGVKIENGQVDLASVAFEPGHQVLDIDRTILGDDIEPTLENLVSGTAVRDRYGSEPSELPQDDLLWNELAEYLSHGLRNTILYWSPDAIVLGGSMIEQDPHINIDSVRKYTTQNLNGFVPAPLITKAKLGDDAVLWGAMAILKAQE